MPNKAELNLTVVYPAAKEPFHEKEAPKSETLRQLKPTVLDFFHLKEGTSPDGTTTTYTFYHGKEPLEDLSRTLGSIAGEAEALQLKLSQQITQG
jgi:hypothetical protein